MERFKQLFEEVKGNQMKAELLFRFLSPDSSIELYEEYVRLEEEQYELYSEMVGEIMESGLAELFYDNLMVILPHMDGLEFSIRESKRLIKEMKAA